MNVCLLFLGNLVMDYFGVYWCAFIVYLYVLFSRFSINYLRLILLILYHCPSLQVTPITILNLFSPNIFPLVDRINPFPDPQSYMNFPNFGPIPVLPQLAQSIHLLTLPSPQQHKINKPPRNPFAHTITQLKLQHLHIHTVTNKHLLWYTYQELMLLLWLR